MKRVMILCSILFVSLASMRGIAESDILFSVPSTQAWQKFVAKYGTGFCVNWDEKIEVPRKIYGKGIVIKEGNINDTNEAMNLMYQFLSQHRDLFKIDTENLKISSVEDDQEYFYMKFNQYYNDVQVFSAFLGATIKRNGEIVSIGGRIYPNITISTLPQIRLEKALKIVEESNKDTIEVHSSELVIIPVEGGKSTDYKLIILANSNLDL